MQASQSFPVLHLNYRIKIPLFQQVEAQIRAWIENGVLQPGDPLPTVRELASQLDVNFNTIARAYRLLDSQNMIITWQGRGTVVADWQGQPTAAPMMPARHSLHPILINVFQQALQAGYSEHAIHQLVAHAQRAWARSGASRTFAGQVRITRQRYFPKKKTLYPCRSIGKLRRKNIDHPDHQSAGTRRNHVSTRRK